MTAHTPKFRTMKLFRVLFCMSVLAVTAAAQTNMAAGRKAPGLYKFVTGLTDDQASQLAQAARRGGGPSE